MLTRSRLIPLVCCFLWLGQSVSAQPPGRASVLPDSRMLNHYGLERAWWGRATMVPTRDTIEHITVDEENLYVLATSGILTAFNNETGRHLWAVKVAVTDEPTHMPVSNQETVLVATSRYLLALDKREGDILWRLRLPETPSTRPGVDGEQVYIGSLTGKVHAFDLETIQDFHSEGRLPKWSLQTRNWVYQGGSEIAVPPVSNGRVVLFASRGTGSRGGSLFSVATENRQLNFQFETDARISAPLARSDRFVYLAAEDFNFYCVDMNNGELRWQFVTGQPIRKAPRVVGDDVFLTPSQGGMYRLSASSGEQQWWSPEATEFLSATPTRVFVASGRRHVMILDRQDGARLGVLPLRHLPVRVNNDRTDRLYLATEDGFIVCLREQGREFPIYHLHPERRPIMPPFAPADSGTGEDGAAPMSSSEP